ncbi:DUF6884 domain-containing protein [Thermococcus thermotolerans]|uniref:DUF6884 domain-containing protein n=1 Tax=Thermococcus thermotolerans TaxID=2969672 RepID=UPI002156F8A0|nr:DUF6884 domain-containing protein [Thermococcus thermotolerans]
MRKSVVLVTACGNKKEEEPLPAGRLYKSSRIRHLYRKSKELGVPLYILSAKYGLVNSDTIIEPYDQIMTMDRVHELLPQVKRVLKEFDIVVFYQGGARKEYRILIEMACKDLGIPLVKYGYKNMGDIKETEKILRNILEGSR